MGTLARNAAKVLLFCGLFLLAVRYIHTYPLPLTLQQQHFWIVISETFGVEDSELFYIGSMVAVDLVVTIVVYAMLMRLSRRYRAKQ
jgi:hypothetical protein